MYIQYKVNVSENQVDTLKDAIRNTAKLCAWIYTLQTTRLHKNVDGTFVTPIPAYDGRVYVLDDVATMEVDDRSLTKDTINSKVIYFAKSDGE